MANWSGGLLTTKGQALQAKVDAGQTELLITKMKIGSGTADSLQNLTDLVEPQQNIAISGITAADNLTTITGVITNIGLTEGFYVRELGVYATDPDDGEILYSVTADSAPDYLPAEGDSVTVSQEFNYYIAVSNASSVSATLSTSGLVTTGMLQSHTHDGTGSNGPQITSTGLADSSVIDAKIGTRTIDDTVTAASGAGLLTNLLSKIGNMIKQITGKANWYTAPATTLEAINTLIVTTATANKLLKLDANSKLPASITGNADGNAATATKLQTARTINGVSFDGTANITVTDSTKAPIAHSSTATTYGVSTAANYGHAMASSATPLVNGTAAVGTDNGKFAREGHVHPSDTTKANLASPTFTGTPAAPTATSGTSTTQLATTAFVQAALTTSAYDSAHLLSASGYQKLSNGLILQWGNIAASVTGNITFPIAFPTACFAVFPAWGDSGGGNYALRVLLKTTTYFTRAGHPDDGGTTPTAKNTYFAIGY